jgi:hypothetical protein
MAKIPKTVYRSNITPSKCQYLFLHRKRKITPEIHMETQKILHSQRNAE